MKKIIFLIIFLTINVNTFSQNQPSVNFALRRKLAIDKNENEKMFLLVKGDVIKIRQFVSANKGTFINSAGDIASIRLSLNAISLLINNLL